MKAGKRSHCVASFEIVFFCFLFGRLNIAIFKWMRQSGNWNFVLRNLCFQIEHVQRARSILKLRVWLQTKFALLDCTGKFMFSHAGGHLLAPWQYYSFFSDKPLVLKQFIKRPPLGSTYLGMVPRPRFVCCQRDCFISGPRLPKKERNVVTGSPGAIFVRALVKWYTTGWIEIDVKFDGTVWSGMIRAGKIKQVCCLII